MKVIDARNVNGALPAGLDHLLASGVPEPSRNGPVLVAPGPVTTAYGRPWERVLFSAVRDANPFFHFMEGLWMLAGRNDLSFPLEFNSKFGSYSDDGSTLRGAYGHRWRHWFGYDQLAVIAKELRANPSSRRCVLAMWDGAGSYAYAANSDAIASGDTGDLLATTVDKPCNTHIYFRVRQDMLDMTVCCRSNDVLWGAYGANAVHMSMLQEYMATAVGVAVGTYYQVSNNYHLYTDVCGLEKTLALIDDCDRTDYYAIMNLRYGIQLVPMVSTEPEAWMQELDLFLSLPANAVLEAHTFNDGFFQNVAKPMRLAWAVRKINPEAAQQYAGKIMSVDWRMACVQWLGRREKNSEVFPSGR